MGTLSLSLLGYACFTLLMSTLVGHFIYAGKGHEMKNNSKKAPFLKAGAEKKEKYPVSVSA